MYVTGFRVETTFLTYNPAQMQTSADTSSFFLMSALTFEFKFAVFVPSINALSSRIHIMKQLLDQLKGHSHRSWMPGVLSALGFVIAAFGGDSVKERIHSDSSTSPLSAHHSYQFRRGYKRRCVFVSRSSQSRPAGRDLYSSVAALFSINRHYLSKVHVAWLQLEIST